jgi:hypothetical protein
MMDRTMTLLKIIGDRWHGRPASAAKALSAHGRNAPGFGRDVSMRMILVILMVALIGSGSRPAEAQLYRTLQASAQCVLNYTVDTGSREAASMIQSACNDLYGKPGLLRESNRQYDLCLLRHLSGVQNRQAAVQIASACRTLHPLF